jgi:DNA-directed RNA polymerase specialized sigma24 family protein
LHAWSDYSYAEIAAHLNIPLSTVEGRIYRARVQLGKLLSDPTEEKALEVGGAKSRRQP